MPGFTASGGLSHRPTDSDVIFALKNSKGEDLKTYRVPASEADAFEKGLAEEEKSIRSSVGESEKLTLIRIQKAF